MSGTARGRGVVLLLCYLGFISLGLPDTVVGVAWPSVRREFGLEHGDLSWIFIGAGCSYFLSSFFAGRFLRRFNIGVLLAASSGLVALAGFDYAFAGVWRLFAAGSLLHGLGSGAIDAGLNHYVASHFSARHMNWLHACYSLGAMLGPAVMTAMIGWGDSWRMGYLAVIFPLLMTRTPQRMGKGIAAHAIGFQVGAAMLGAAALPSLTGWIAEAAGLGWVAVTVFLMAAVLFVLHEGLLLLTRGDGRGAAVAR